VCRGCIWKTLPSTLTTTSLSFLPAVWAFSLAAVRASFFASFFCSFLLLQEGH